MTWSGANMRCPKCNKYLPDRCTCNGPSIEERRSAAVAAPGDEGLPHPVISTGNCFPNFADGADQPYYTADQMRQYARDAIAADRRARGMVPSQMREPKSIVSPSVGAQEGERPEPSPMYFDALKIVRESQRASVSLVQRRLRISWDSARDMVELMLSRRDVPVEWAPPVYQITVGQSSAKGAEGEQA
jgi:hypothetical protein